MTVLLIATARAPQSELDHVGAVVLRALDHDAVLTDHRRLAVQKMKGATSDNDHTCRSREIDMLLVRRVRDTWQPRNCRSGRAPRRATPPGLPALSL
jgi:hypothetical protein